MKYFRLLGVDGRMTVPLKSVWLSVFLCIFVIDGANSQYFNTRCSGHSQCLSSQFLQCLNGYCQCDSRSQVFDHNTNQCTMLPGKTCTIHGNNAIGYPKCSKNSACILSRCECQPGYSPSGDLVCKANFQNSCRGPQDCDSHQGLICLGGSCQCRNTSLTYQGIFGCVNPSNPQFVEMMTALKTTETLLQENNVDLDEMINELDPSPNALDSIPLSQIQSRQLFSDSNSGSTDADSVDLTTSAQNQAPAQTGMGFQNLLGILNSLGSLGQLLGGQNRQSAPANNAPAAGGNNLQNLFSGFTNMLNIFNRIIPRIRNFKRMINPIRIIRRLIMNLRGVKAGYPAAIKPKPTYGPPAAGYGPPSTTPSPGGYGGPAAADPGPPAAPPANEAPQASFNTFRSTSVSNYPTVPASQQTQSTFQNPLQGFQSQNTYQVQNPPQQANFNQNQQQQGFTNQNQPLQSNAYQTLNVAQGNQFQPPSNQQFQSFNNQNQNGQFPQSYQNNQNVPNENNQNFQNQNFQSQNQNAQSFQQPQQPSVGQSSNQNFQLNGFQQQSNTFGNYQPTPTEPTVNHLPGVSNNQFPRQERQSTTEEDSPYLPEHL